MNNRSDASNDPFRAFIDAGTGEPLRKSMLQQMERFWEGQRKLLDEYETISQALNTKHLVLLTAGRLSVEPIYTVEGDVNLKTGNILFLGTVFVKV